MRSPGTRHVAIRHPIAYVAVAALLGLPFAWVVVGSARAWLWHTWVSEWFRDDDWTAHAVPFALACVTLAWVFRARIARASARSALPSALGARCSEVRCTWPS